MHVLDMCRYMATGKHIGKVVLRVREEEPRGAAPAPPRLLPALPCTYMHPAKSYVLVGTYTHTHTRSVRAHVSPS